MILVMFVQTYTTIRSLFSKPSDFPITFERLNSTTYAYATVKRSAGRASAIWMFNFLSFAGNLLDVHGKFDSFLFSQIPRNRSL